MRQASWRGSTATGAVWALAIVLALAGLAVVKVASDASRATSGSSQQSFSQPNASVLNGKRPFSATSPWNTPTPHGTRWFDTPTLHSLASPINGDAFRHWWVDTESVRIWRSQPSDPLWTFRLAQNVAPAFHRNRPATILEMRAPWRLDSKAVTVLSGSPVVIDPSITEADVGKGVTWPGAVGHYYVATVTAGAAFILSSSPSKETDINANTSASRVTIGLTTGADGDLLALVDPTSGKYVEAWPAAVDLVARTVTTPASPNGNWATGNTKTGAGAGTIANNDGVRPANFSLIGGVITGADLASGKIDHALVVALPRAVLEGGAGTPRPYRAPATAADTSDSNGPIVTGSRIGIPAGVRKPAKLSAVGSMVFDALQKYGLLVGGFTGGNWPMFYTDNATVTPAQVDPLYAFWRRGGSSDMEKIGPLLRVADYQP